MDMRAVQVAYAVALCAVAPTVSGQLEIPKPLPGNGTVESTQDIMTEAFFGQSADVQPLNRKYKLRPHAHGFHQDGGNTRTQDWPAPLGESPETFSRNIGIQALYHDDSGFTIARMTCDADNSSFCLAVLDPDTLDPLEYWRPENQTLFSPYGTMVDRRIIFPTLERFIYEMDVFESAGVREFREVRAIDLTNNLSGPVMSCGYDEDGNLWFLSASLPVAGDAGSVTSTIGYVALDGGVYTMSIPDQRFENSIAVHRKTAYIVTGPANAADTSNAVGYIYAVEAGGEGDGEIITVWRNTYDAGSSVKPGGVARGAGSSPALLGDSFIAFTDNADTQVNLNVFRQANSFRENGTSFVCKVPLFAPGASSNENAMVGYFDGEATYSVVVNNNYGNPGLQSPTTTDINGEWNSYMQLAPGLDRVDISSEGECTMKWQSDLVSTTGTQLSTATGLLYAYTQDLKLAEEGKYVWYFTALDFRTGKLVWQKRAGAGGSYNNNFQHAQIAPDGNVYMPIIGGITWVKDAET